MKHHPENLQAAGLHRGADHIDYRETPDVTEAHTTAAAREHPEPAFGTVPAPLWLIAVAGVAVFWAGAYLGMFSGGFSADVYNERSGMPKVAKGGPQTGGPGVETKQVSMAEEGKRYFTQNCVSCHQATGLGVPGQYPPLAKSEFVNGGSQRLMMIVLKGLTGPMKVSGTQYNGAMPPWEKSLTDKKIAAILTYIRQEWGNKASEIAVDDVAAARKQYKDRAESWNEASILEVPADANIGGGTAAPAPK